MTSMGGLYSRALEIYRGHSNLHPESEDDDASSIDEIPISERETVLEEIDRVIETNRVRIGSDELKLVARSSGRMLPLTANLIIALSATALLLVFSSRLNQQERLLQSGQQRIQTAESLVVQAVRQESADQLKKKDSEILGIQEKLRQASLERDSIRNQAEVTIQQKEKEFAGRLEQALATEKGRLTNIGLSEPEIERRLSDYESQLKANFASQIEAFRTETEARAAEKDKVVADQIASYETSLKQSQEERAKLEQTYADREAQLTRQYSEQAKQQESSTTQAQTDLARLQSAAAEDRLLSSQILNSYETVRTNLEISDYRAALGALGALRASFDQEPAVSSKSVQERRPVDMFIIGSLEDLIRARTQQSSETKKTDPEVDKLIASGSTSSARQDWQSTLDEYRRALVLLLGDAPAADRLVAQVAEAGYRIGAAKDTVKWSTASAALDRSKQLAASIGRVKDQVGALPDAPGSAPITTAELASLLQAKLLVWQIIGSDPVKSKYPELYATMQHYFDIYSAQQQQRGRTEGLQSVLAILDSIGGSANGPTAGPQLSSADDRATMVKILDRVSALVR